MGDQIENKIIESDKTLFINGDGHDVVLQILGVEWRLHKLKLMQSPYFASMFSGSWNETTQPIVKIVVPDENISLDAIGIVLNSLYQDVNLVQKNIIGVLAGATFFQLDELVALCIDFMHTTLGPQTAVTYYTVYCKYNFGNLKQELLQEWFPANLLQLYYESSPQLGSINIELMMLLLLNPKLCVIKTEFSLYLMLRRWLYLLIHKTSESPDNSSASSYFRDRPENDGPFLSTDEGSAYTEVFRYLRLPHLVLCPLNRDTISADRIIPQVWLQSSITDMLDAQSRTNFEVNSEMAAYGLEQSLLQSLCMRSAQLVKAYSESWRWNIIPVGLYLDWSVSGNRISLGLYRNCCLEKQATKAIIEVTLYNLDNQSRINSVHKSESRKIEINDNHNAHIPLWGYVFRGTPVIIAFSMVLDVLSIEMFNSPLPVIDEGSSSSGFAMLEIERL